MMLSTLDMAGIIIALSSLIAVVITSGIQNARLTRSRDEWRAHALEARGR